MGKKGDTNVGKPIRDTMDIDNNFSKNLICYHAPKAHASEAYRSLRTNIGFLGVDNQIKTIVVTSPDQAEGKTTTSANIAISMAQAEKKVLIIEADLRKPRVYKYFGVPNDIGLVDIIIDDIEPKTAIKQVKGIENLYILTCGIIPPNPTEILESTKMDVLLDRFKDNFDIIIIDTPPVGVLADAAILSKKTDGVILVVASGESKIEMAQSAKSALENVNANILGVILTKLNKGSGGAYYNRYSSYYYE